MINQTAPTFDEMVENIKEICLTLVPIDRDPERKILQMTFDQLNDVVDKTIKIRKQSQS